MTDGRDTGDPSCFFSRLVDVGKRRRRNRLAADARLALRRVAGRLERDGLGHLDHATLPPEEPQSLEGPAARLRADGSSSERRTTAPRCPLAVAEGSASPQHPKWPCPVWTPRLRIPAAAQSAPFYPGTEQSRPFSSVFRIRSGPVQSGHPDFGSTPATHPPSEEAPVGTEARRVDEEAKGRRRELRSPGQAR